MNDRLSKLLKNPNQMSIVIGVLAFGAGACVGYFVRGQRKPKLHLVPPAKPFDHEAMQDFIIKEKAKMGIIQTKEQLQEMLNSNKDLGKKKVEEILITVKEPDTEEPTEAVARTIFAKKSGDWDIEEEQKNRSSSAPYVLHKDEFYADELDYSQNTLTYYSGDDILVDEDDAPVYNHYNIVGPMLFGHGSGDQNVFYVRNDKRKAEYEIIFDPGLYSVEVLGLHIENNERVKNLKHSNNTPKFRLE